MELGNHSKQEIEYEPAVQLCDALASHILGYVSKSVACGSKREILTLYAAPV